MVENHHMSSNADIKIMERSIYSAKFFIDVNKLNGNLTSLQYDILCDTYNHLIKCIDQKVDLVGNYIFFFLFF